MSSAASSRVLDVSRANWNREVLEANGLVMVGFWADWCDPCQAVLVVLEELAETYVGKVKILKANVDEQADLAGTYRISIVPTIVFFRGGLKLDELICSPPKSLLETKIQLMAV